MENKKRTLQKMPPLKIGNVEMPNPLVLAPMAGVTDLAFRTICAELGAAVTVTEMVSFFFSAMKLSKFRILPTFLPSYRN